MPLMRTCPSVARMRPPTIFKNVVLPQPLGPSRLTNLPRCSSNEMLSIARTSPPSGMAKTLRTCTKDPKASEADTVCSRVVASACIGGSGLDRRRGEEARRVDVRRCGRLAAQAHILHDEVDA